MLVLWSSLFEIAGLAKSLGSGELGSSDRAQTGCEFAWSLRVVALSLPSAEPDNPRSPYARAARA